jgi:S1-C subfamily serine protease
VRIDVTGRNFQGSGSGTIIDARGYVVTNYHVIAQARTIKVTVMDVGVFDGAVVAGDETRDLALVEISIDRTDLPAVALGTEFDMVVGVDVLAGGFPLGADLAGPATFTKGIISAVRTLSDGQTYIQTDAAINPGNSGGCLFTLEAKMIGVPAAGIEPPGEDIEGIGLAIPIDDVLAFIQKNLP